LIPVVAGVHDLQHPHQGVLIKRLQSRGAPASLRSSSQVLMSDFLERVCVEESRVVEGGFVDYPAQPKEA